MITIRGLEIFFLLMVGLEVSLLYYIYVKTKGKTPSEE